MLSDAPSEIIYEPQPPAAPRRHRHRPGPDAAAQGRLTNAELAERVGLSASACLRRVQRLEQEGVIAGYRGIVDPRSIGLGLEAFVRVKLVQKDQKAIAASPSKCEVGGSGGLLHPHRRHRLHAAPGGGGPRAYSDFVVGRLLTAPAMASVNSSIVLRTVKEYAGLPTRHLSTPA